jgi:hypothetical protein
MNEQSPADIVAKRDEFNNRFGAILKKLDPSILLANDPKSLLQGINTEFYEKYVGQVKKREEVQQNTFSLKRGWNTTKEYTSYFVYQTLQLFFAFLFAVIVANDVIGRPPIFRAYFFIFTFFVIFIYPYAYIVAILYYLFRFFNGTSPLLFSVLPLYPKEFGPDDKRSFFTFFFDVHKKEDYAITKEFNYYKSLAETIGSSLSMENYKTMTRET